MIENKLKFFFKNQIWHIGGLIVLYYVALQMVDFENNSNIFLVISAKNWFLFSMMTPLLHQGYVWLCWRSELCWKTISRTIGFKGYVLIFFLLFLLIVHVPPFTMDLILYLFLLQKNPSFFHNNHSNIG